MSTSKRECTSERAWISLSRLSRDALRVCIFLFDYSILSMVNQGPFSTSYSESYISLGSSSSILASSQLSFQFPDPCSIFTSFESESNQSEELGGDLFISSVFTFGRIFCRASLSRKRSYHPLLKLKFYRPQIFKSYIIFRASRRISFRFSLGFAMMNEASRSSISGYSALRPPSFFLSSLAWNQRVIFLGWIPYYFAFARMILDRPLEVAQFSSRTFSTSLFLNQRVQLRYVIDPFLRPYPSPSLAISRQFIF